MNEYTKNRFKEFDNLSLEELKSKKIKLTEEVLYAKKILEDKRTSSEQKSETIEDLRFYREQLSYIEELISLKSHTKSK